MFPQWQKKADLSAMLKNLLMNLKIHTQDLLPGHDY